MTTNSKDVSSHYVRRWLGRFAPPSAFTELLDALRECADLDAAAGEPPDPDIARAIRDVENAAIGILVDCNTGVPKGSPPSVVE